MIRKILLTAFLGLMACGSFAQVFNVRTVKDSLFIPWEILYAPDDHIWFTQKNGFICRLNPATRVVDTLYHETATVIRGEGGMTGMALHPGFPAQPYVYVAHNYLQGSAYKIRIMRYTYNGSNALGSPLMVLDNINGSNNHNGCRLVATGDQLFITTGDAETPANAQNPGLVNGKVLRIRLDGSIPGDNPFPGNPVWSWGHRNPQGLVLKNGVLYSSEHGANSDDEINIIKKGRNFGWPNVEGFCNTPAEITYCTDSNIATPVMAWTPTLAVSGIDYYDQPMFTAWQHTLLMATLKDEHLYVLRLNAAKDSVVSATVASGVNAGRLRDICISPAGRVYISTSNSNAAGTGPFTDKIIELSDPAATAVGQPVLLHMQLSPNPVQKILDIRLSREVRGQYRITDMQGRTVQTGPVAASGLQIGVENLAPSVYFLTIKEDQGNFYAQPFIKVQ